MSLVYLFENIYKLSVHKTTEITSKILSHLIRTANTGKTKNKWRRNVEAIFTAFVFQNCTFSSWNKVQLYGPWFWARCQLDGNAHFRLFFSTAASEWLSIYIFSVLSCGWALFLFFLRFVCICTYNTIVTSPGLMCPLHWIVDIVSILVIFVVVLFVFGDIWGRNEAYFDLLKDMW